MIDILKNAATLAANLTVQEYAVLRNIRSFGDINQKEIEKLTPAEAVAFESLIRKGLLINHPWDQAVKKGRYAHPHPDIEYVMATCRSLLGINRL